MLVNSNMLPISSPLATIVNNNKKDTIINKVGDKTLDILHTFLYIGPKALRSLRASPRLRIANLRAIVYRNL
jgi:hypothetical protein